MSAGIVVVTGGSAGVGRATAEHSRRPDGISASSRGANGGWMLRLRRSKGWDGSPVPYQRM